MVEIVAPKVGGVTASDGTTVPAQQKINGGPSVLYDAVAVLPSADGAALLANEATAQGLRQRRLSRMPSSSPTAETAQPLFDKAGLTEMDGGFVALRGRGGCEGVRRGLPRSCASGSVRRKSTRRERVRRGSAATERLMHRVIARLERAIRIGASRRSSPCEPPSPGGPR